MNSFTSPPRHDHISTALVLGGGGSAGNAWEIGVIAGLVEAGLDVTRADLIIGTSAGSTAAAQVTGGTPLPELFAAAVAPVSRPSDAAPAGGATTGARPSISDQLAWSDRIIASALDAADMRRRLGHAILERDGSTGTDPGRWRDIVASRLPRPEWPDQRVLVTAVDAETGEPVVFDRQSGVELVDAVAASCSSGAAHRIGEHRYIDGGYRRNENADLAGGYGRVLVLSPFAGRTRHPLAWGMQLDAQVDELRAGGSLVETIFPDSAALEAFGDNVMNPASRPPAARAGFAQGRGAAVGLRDFWGAR